MIPVTEFIFGKWLVSNFPTIFRNVLTTNGKLWGCYRQPWRFSKNLGFDFGKATGLELFNFAKKTYSSYFLRLQWRTAFFQKPLNVYFWMDNERLNIAQSLALWPIYTYSKSTAVKYNTRSSYEIFSKLTINAS